MRRNVIFKTNRSQFTWNLLVNLAGSLILSVSQPTIAQVEQKSYVSPQDVSQALYEAVRNKDDQTIQAILGAPQLASTGIDEEDKLDRERFGQKYQEMHRLVREPDGSVVLYIGAENWPFPIPLVATKGRWHFDSEAGAEEIRAREIGENETSAIKACEVMSKDGRSEKENANVDDDVVQFARNLTETEHKNSRNTKLFHSYYFRILSEGAGNIVVVAYPSKYGTTGVMTFIVRGDGLYEKDLGPDTAAVAQRIQGKPAGNWNRVQ